MARLQDPRWHPDCHCPLEGGRSDTVFKECLVLDQGLHAFSAINPAAYRAHGDMERAARPEGQAQGLGLRQRHSTFELRAPTRGGEGAGRHLRDRSGAPSSELNYIGGRV